MTTREEIAGWFDYGVAQGATHMIVVCDTFDWEDYPVFVAPDEDARERYEHFNERNMQKVMEVYNLSMDKGAQLVETRAYHY